MSHSSHPPPPPLLGSSLPDIRSVIHPTESLSPALRTLRRSYELLSVSYFVSIFGPTVGFPDFSLRKLEADLDGTRPDSYAPMLASRLLVLLTGDRCINMSNWEARLRKEFLRRDPAENPLGVEPVKAKVRMPKRAVGYAYITEYVFDVPKVAQGKTSSPAAQGSIPPQLLPDPQMDTVVNGVKLNAQIQDVLPKSDVPAATSHCGETVVGKHAVDATTSEPILAIPLPPCHQLPQKPEPVSAQTCVTSDPKLTSTYPSDAPSIVENPLALTSLPAHGTSSPAPPTPSDERTPEDAPLTIPWADLPGHIKLRALFKLCEWNFETSHDVDRLRRMIDGKATGFSGLDALTGTSTAALDSGDWRQERCGVDANGHSYWFTGQGIESTLWVQRKEPKPLRKTVITLRLSAPSRGRGRGKQPKARSNLRKRPLEESVNENGLEGDSSLTPLQSGIGRSRPSSTAPSKYKRPRLSGTRTSSRLRSGSLAEECQSVSASWHPGLQTNAFSPSVPPQLATVSDRGCELTVEGCEPTMKRPENTKLLPSRSPAERPPTVIVIKNSGFMALKSTKQERVVSGTRASSRRRVGEGENWQVVPEGWLEEVVQTASNQNLPPGSTNAQSRTLGNGSIPSKAHGGAPPSSSGLSSELTDDLSVEDNGRQSPEKLLPTELIEGDSDVKMNNGTKETVDQLPSLDTPSLPPSLAAIKHPIALSQPLLNMASPIKVEPGKTQNVDASSELPSRDMSYSTVSIVTENIKGMEFEVGQAQPDTDFAPSVTDRIENIPRDVRAKMDTTLDVSVAENLENRLMGGDKEAKAVIPLGQLNKEEIKETTMEAKMAKVALDPSTKPSAAEELKLDEKPTTDTYPELKGHPLDSEWIGWEVVCSNLTEWQQFCRQFEGTQNPDEIALVTLVNETVLPLLAEAYAQHENFLKMEEALAQRKRSSRLATKEVVEASAAEAYAVAKERETRLHSERIEAQRLKEKEAEEEPNKKEEDQRLVRLREREERIALREAQMIMEQEADKKRKERARLRAEAKVLGLAVKVAKSGVENGVTPSESGENWELNCEICGVMGKNMVRYQDDGSEVICCDKCEIWQHLACHDKADEILRQAKRNWTTADFICATCSGIPIPRAVAKLRTHINGKPKPKPRQRTKKPKVALDGFPRVDELGTDVPAATRPKSRITLFVSHPDKLASRVPSKSGLESDVMSAAPSAYSNVNSQARDIQAVGGHGSFQNPHISPALASAHSSLRSLAPIHAATGLEPYYDDLEKLIPILRRDFQLHRTLPVSVMHRVRRYLIDQQQRIAQSSKPSTSSTVHPPQLASAPKPLLNQAIIPSLAELTPAINYDHLPPISTALPTAANWYDESNEKDSTLIESFVDPSFNKSFCSKDDQMESVTGQVTNVEQQSTGKGSLMIPTFAAF